ncbi:MAG: hypothetical protein AAF298_11900 [Cyanobacteria bacterium P01_A01_bin.40]
MPTLRRRGRISAPYFAGNNNSGFGGRREASALVQGSLPETTFYPNHILPTLQGDRFQPE